MLRDSDYYISRAHPAITGYINGLIVKIETLEKQLNITPNIPEKVKVDLEARCKELEIHVDSLVKNLQATNKIKEYWKTKYEKLLNDTTRSSVIESTS